jgi:hypothetical protein
LGKAKEATGNDVYWWYGGFLVSLAISMLLLIKATQNLPIGTAYAVWTGIGAVGTTLIGMSNDICPFFFQGEFRNSYPRKFLSAHKDLFIK